MPYNWNNIKVVTIDELVPKYYTPGTLQMTIYRYKNKSYGLDRVQLGGNGRKMLIRFDSLPKNIQDEMKHLPVEKYEPYAF